MNYNKPYIDIKLSLINSFLIEKDKNIVDISYSIDKDSIKIQVILVEEVFISAELKKEITEKLVNYNVEISEKFITKEKFNDIIDEWLPKHYNWLQNLLYSQGKIF